MATNPHFDSNYDGPLEQDLVDCLTIESIQIHGLDVQYVKRDAVGFDALLNEDMVSKYEDVYTIEMYIKSFDTFGGQGDFISKFGYEISDEVTLQVSKTRFKEEVTVNDASIIRPREGDLIYFPFSKRVFEIRFVEHEDVFYQAGTLYTYELRCKLFDVAGEDFITALPEIDSTEQNDSDVKFTLVPGGTGVFLPGELVTQTVGIIVVASAQVDSFNDPVLIVHDITGAFVLGTDIIGATSGAIWSWTDDSFPVANVNDPNSQNNIVNDGFEPLVVLGKNNRLA